MTRERTGRAAFFVAVGILASRIAGLFRQSVFAHFFGASAAGDAFQAAFRIPNMLQNLFGEGVLSASFIPEYSTLLARGDREGAKAIAGAVFAVLSIVTASLVLIGVTAAPYLVDLLASGFEPSQREFATGLVRILFPGAAILVLSAWCLGILNSHRLFLLSYLAPLAWNAVMIGALIVFGDTNTQESLATKLAWASVVGSLAQFLVQIPSVIKVAGFVRPNLNFAMSETRRVFRNFFPAFFTRGVAQISGLIDLTLASYLPIGAVSAIAYAQTLYMLPGSLFGMSVSAAELPAMSSVIGEADEVAEILRDRLRDGLERIAYFVIPCAVAFIALGDVIVAALFQTGQFERDETVWVWQILAAASVGLLASTLGRLTTSTFFVLRDTRTPFKYSIVRLVIGTGLGVLLAFFAPRWMGIDPKFGAMGLTLASAIAGCIEFVLLRRALSTKIGKVEMTAGYLSRVWITGLVSGATAWVVYRITGADNPITTAVIVFATFGIVYLALTNLLAIPTALDITSKLSKLRNRLSV